MLSRFCVTSNKLLLSKPPRGQSSQLHVSPSLLFCDVSAAPDSVAQLLRETTSSCGFSSITWSWLLPWLSHFTYERPPTPRPQSLGWLPFKTSVWSKAPTTDFSSPSSHCQVYGSYYPYAEGFQISFSCPDFLSDFHFQLPTQHLNFFIQLACLILHGWNRILGTTSPTISCLTPLLVTSRCSQNRTQGSYSGLPSPA